MPPAPAMICPARTLGSCSRRSGVLFIVPLPLLRHSSYLFPSACGSFSTRGCFTLLLATYFFAFQEEVLVGREFRDRRFESIELVATSLQKFLKIVHLPKYQNTLWILHATRIDLLQGVLEHIEEHKAAGTTGPVSSVFHLQPCTMPFCSCYVLCMCYPVHNMHN